MEALARHERKRMSYFSEFQDSLGSQHKTGADSWALLLRDVGDDVKRGRDALRQIGRWLSETPECADFGDFLLRAANLDDESVLAHVHLLLNYLGTKTKHASNALDIEITFDDCIKNNRQAILIWLRRAQGSTQELRHALRTISCIFNDKESNKDECIEFISGCAELAEAEVDSVLVYAVEKILSDLEREG